MVLFQGELFLSCPIIPNYCAVGMFFDFYRGSEQQGWLVGCHILTSDMSLIYTSSSSASSYKVTY